MIKRIDRRKHRILIRQLQRWTLIGPVRDISPAPLWSPMELDGIRRMPQKIPRLHGQPVSVKRRQVIHPASDLRKYFGVLPGNPQCYLVNEFTVSEAVTVEFLYSAEAGILLWLDGREVANTTSRGNSGWPGKRYHRVLLALTPGRHLLVMRSLGDEWGWRLAFKVVSCRPGIDDLLRTDRAASWRDYTKTLIRYENRPFPYRNKLIIKREEADQIADGFPFPPQPCHGVSKEEFEMLMANLGVEARWISASHQSAGAYFKSRYLPMWPYARREFERELKEWVRVLHSRKICAMNYYAFSNCGEGWKRHPDWRVHNIGKGDRGSYPACCVNTGYGDALIGFAIETLKKFDFDGIWFDGSGMAGFTACACPACARKFKAEKGLALPDRYDWNHPSFARWVQWRYDSFTAFWQRLADAVHRAIPQARLCFSHGHRYAKWGGGVPLKPFGRDFVATLESGGDQLTGYFNTRLLYAFGRPHIEVWTNMQVQYESTTRGLLARPRNLMECMLTVYTAGGYASGGGDWMPDALLFGKLSEELQWRRPYLGLPGFAQTAFHVSQQTETFVFGRNLPAMTLSPDEYGRCLTGWSQILGRSGLFYDVVFDDHLKFSRLKNYNLLIMPLAQALTDAQYRAVHEFVSRGGCLVTGPWFGVCNEWGEPRTVPIGERTAFPFGSVMPAWDVLNHRREVTVRSVTGQRFSCSPLRDPGLVNRIVSLEWTRSNPLFHHVRLGRGCIIQWAVDLGTLYPYWPFYQERSDAVLAAVSPPLHKLARPIVEFKNPDGLVLAVFKKGPSVVVHVQQLTESMKIADRLLDSMPARDDVVLVWHGPKPREVRCVLSDQTLILKTQSKGNGWHVRLPPIRWGGIVIFVP